MWMPLASASPTNAPTRSRSQQVFADLARSPVRSPGLPIESFPICALSRPFPVGTLAKSNHSQFACMLLITRTLPVDYLWQAHDPQDESTVPAERSGGAHLHESRDD